MSDIADALEQDAVADSLLGDSPMVETPSDQEGGDFDRDLAGPVDRGDEVEADDDGLGELREYLQEQEQEAFEPQQEQEGEPQQEPTAQEVQAGIQQLDQVVNELGLNDPGEAAALATDLGLPANSAAPLGSALAKVAVSATEVWQACAGDLQNMPAIPHESAVAFTNDLLRSMGVDPRTAEVNPERLSATVLIGACNLLSAVDRYGLGASMDQLNSPEGAMWFATNLSQCLGGGECTNLEGALRLADSAGRFFLSAWSKLAAQRAEQPQSSRQSQGRRSSGRSSSRVFQTNDDLFNEGAELWRYAHGRL